MDAAFTTAATLMDPPLEQVQIPYGGQTLPAWFVRAPGSGRQPTVIRNNGSDGSDAQNVDLWAYGAQAAQERGYHSLILTGPGQGELLFVRQEPFRPDWEQVITPVVDYLAERSDVDASKIALTGWSFGGALVAGPPPSSRDWPR
ncbi:MAG: alpha/beta hydrolase family protein [Actinomycetota bacterium]